MAHTRHFTTGSPSINVNNHPVVSDNIVCVHNGRVDNHNDLIAMTGLERQGTVDSWALPAMLSQRKQLGASVCDLLELVEGVASLAWMDTNEPGTLHLARLSTRPLCIGWTRRGDLVFSSTPSTLRKAMAASKIRIEDVSEMTEGTHLTIHEGNIVEWQEFKPNHPEVIVAEDMPDAKKQAAKPSKVEQETLDNLDGFDAWESEVNWDEIVPRRPSKVHGY